jgi:hypothetical protein
VNARANERFNYAQPLDPIVLKAATLQGQGVDSRAHLRLIVLSLASGFTVTLPKPIGSGLRLLFSVGITVTSNAYILKRAVSTDIIQGIAWTSFGTTNVAGYIAGSTDNTITLNGTTSGGYVGDLVELVDTIAGVWSCRAFLQATTSSATPFSNT